MKRIDLREVTYKIVLSVEWKNGKRVEEVKTYLGWFHKWTKEQHRIGEISQNITMALVETRDGKIILVVPGDIQFVRD